MAADLGRRVVPYGWWPSSVGADVIAAGSTTYDAVHTSGEAVAWLEARPTDGRTRVVSWTPGHGVRDATPDGFDVGTAIHAYGGGAYTCTSTGLVVVNADDQRLYRVDRERAARPITAPSGDHYGDLRPLDATALICVRERPGGPDDLVVLPVDGSAAPRTLHEGHDFYASPRPSPDGRRLAWVTWDDPNLPWDGSDLWVAELLGTGPDAHLGAARHVAGGRGQSVTQPEWGPDGALYFVSDRSGWWNLHRERDGAVAPLLPMAAEFTDAPWELDYSSYALLPDGRIACRYRQHGLDHLGILAPGGGHPEPLPLPFTAIKPYLGATADRLACIAAHPSTAPAVVALRLSDRHVEVLAEPGMHLDGVSAPEHLAVPARDGGTVHAVYYPPTHPGVLGPPGTRPPLIVQPHPGPTSHAPVRLELRTQFFTSRGFAVVDVNYRGSTGYGRAYRTQLDGRWGVLDAADCADVAAFLAARGDVDPARTVISGASAGGFTALRALTTTDRFTAAVSWFGITDLAAFRAHVPRFQRHHTDHLVGPWPQAAHTYRERSPLHHADRITQPVLVIQGLDDDIVAPEQAAGLVTALRQRGVPVTHLTFPGEGHGLRHAHSISRALDAELTFYRAGPDPGDATRSATSG
ncbi:MAG TPA: prolyl oligopeptidase family serine peptidase [Pseudonocardiaceae bacterium]|jgi:dipeptidyl aminopeptidase/acylaminoacyl peptidase|nr:prolyl oligopeptidase family serine peptidase [Pseudonocardiaceae bacterium]